MANASTRENQTQAALVLAAMELPGMSCHGLLIQSQLAVHSLVFVDRL